MKSECSGNDLLMRNFTIGTAIIATVLFFSGCNKKESAAQEGIDQIVLPVTATGVVEGNIERYLIYTGNVDAARRVEIAPLAPGRIVRILVDEGSHVNRGQVLVKMDDMAVAAVKTGLELAQKNLERTRALQAKGSMTDVQLDGAVSGYAQAKSAYERVVSDIELTAPFSGLIIGKYYNDGEVYSSMKPGPSGLGSILSLARLDKMKIEVKVPEQDFVQIRQGAPVVITVDALQDKTFNGAVSRVSPALDMRSRTATVTVEINNDEKLIRPGMFTRVRIITEEKNDVLKVPTKAVVVRNDSAFVFRVPEGKVPYAAKPERVAVTTGMNNADYTEITGGQLKASDLVISENNVSLTGETAIKVTSIVDSEGK
ncbi:MAG: efflux RND transporter periplasmic adaptor subunit [Chitinispirillaceae bacterium]|nr:efflux RND transporter periplasmic adaptor subunit [Chitinispirillaceae bacterium]